MIDSNGRPIRNTKSSFHHLLCSLEWIPAYQQQEGEQLEKTFLRPGSVYLSLPEVTSLLGTHVFYVDLNSSGFSRALGKDVFCSLELDFMAVMKLYLCVFPTGIRETISVEVLIQYLKDWCTKPLAQNQEQHPEQESEGASFTTTVQHIYNVYSYLQTHCPQSSLKELFQHSPAVFVETHRYAAPAYLHTSLGSTQSPDLSDMWNLFNRRNENWCFGRFYHLKEVCWSDTTTMFSRYRQLTQKQGSSVQEPKILALFYSQLEGMEKFFTRVRCSAHTAAAVHTSHMLNASVCRQMFASNITLPNLSILINLVKKQNS